ncbi:MAG: hypothetical protein ACKN9T_18145 [Candidatus Methylumidiphilus sp.]
MARLTRILKYLLPLCWLYAAAAPAAAVPQAFLIQNSGWMEPFYADPASQLKPLATAIIEAVTTPEQAFFVSAFSQTTADNESPKLLYPNAQNIPLRTAINTLQLAHKSASTALADTDFQEAVSAVILRQFQGKSGIIWVFTNNRNSPHNDQDTARRNKEFYNLLHSEESIVRTLVYNLAMPVQGKVYPKAQGLMVYVLAYGKAAETHLRELTSHPRLKQVLTALPARLKPLDSESVRLIPTEILDAPSVKISLAADQKTTVLEVDASDRQPSVTVKAEMENLFYPYQIDSAKVSAEFIGETAKYPLTVTPEAIAALQAGARQGVAVSFPIPHTQIPSVWSLAQLKHFGTQLKIPGKIAINLTGQQLSLDPAFIQGLRANFPGDPISEMYAPAKEVQSSSVSVPVLIRVNYPVYPLLIITGLILLLLLAAILAWWQLSRSQPVDIIADGVLMRPALKPLQSLPIRNERGELLGEIKRGLSGATIVRVEAGHTLRIK